jgi:hypothetical protein
MKQWYTSNKHHEKQYTYKQNDQKYRLILILYNIKAYTILVDKTLQTNLEWK